MAFEDEEEIDEIRTEPPWYAKIELWLIVLITIFYLLYKGRLGIQDYDKALIYSVTAIIFIALGKTTILALKNNSPKVIFNPHHSTYNEEIQQVGNYGIVKLGGIKAFGLYYGGKDATLVAPITAFNKLGRSSVITTRVENINPDELNPEVLKFITDKGYPSNIIMGFADEEQELSKPDIVKLEAELKEKNTLLNMLKDILGDKFDVIEKSVAAGTRIQERAKGNVIEQLKKALTSKD